VRKCIYCDFLSVPYDESIARKYTEALCRELNMSKDSSVELRTVYVGGGTPSLLPPDCVSALFRCIRNNFALSDEAEITVEANPGTVNEAVLQTFFSFGVNRLSLGVQAFDDTELKMLGRIHSSQEAVKTIELIKATGLNNFSIDLMYGIPGQTAKSWQKTLTTAAALSPAHISAYELTPEKETALYPMIESGRVTLPDEDTVTGMYEAAVDLLAFQGFDHYEISNYARPGFKCRHNLNYWERGEYIGAGAGAHSFLNGLRFMNTGDIREYIDQLEEGIAPRKDTSEVTKEDAAREFLFLGLRKTEGISIMRALAMGLDVQDSCGDLFDDGYIESDHDRIRLTRKGLVLSNPVIVKIFEHSGL
jgi:oxygen-independent coproporphyrinogen-3 oxidase